MSEENSVLEELDRDFDGALERLFELLRIESISTDPSFAGQCRIAADWLVDDLESIGFSARSVPTKGHPMVLARMDGPAGAPHVLFYGHYDVQPVDPLHLWKNPPFEPAIIDAPDGSKQISGRGTSDDKGQLMTFIEACRAWRRTAGGLPVGVTVLLEGEEESGSPSLLPFLDEYKNELGADVALVCDTNMWDRETPAIATSLRGLVGVEITVKAANRDLHSGYYGSAAANPAHVLSRIISGLHDNDGGVTLPGFYDGVEEVPAEILAQWDKLDFSPADFLGEIGLFVPAGEKGRSVLEQVWTRPTAEVNGMTGGYTGEGFKTVIAAEASAKISFRLVGKQNPEKIYDSFVAHANSCLPADCKAEFSPHGKSGAIQLDYKLPQLQKAAHALNKEWGKETALIAMGGSIPIVGHFQTYLGLDSLLIGFGQGDDRIHSPNEKYELSSFKKGARSWARILAALG